jgi:hypothetical protein
MRLGLLCEEDYEFAGRPIPPELLGDVNLGAA